MQDLSFLNLVFATLQGLDEIAKMCILVSAFAAPISTKTSLENARIQKFYQGVQAKSCDVFFSLIFSVVNRVRVIKIVINCNLITFLK